MEPERPNYSQLFVQIETVMPKVKLSAKVKTQSAIDDKGFVTDNCQLSLGGSM